MMPLAMRGNVRIILLAIAALALGGAPAHARKPRGVKVAVAANFTAAAKEIAAGFEKAHAAEVSLSFGSTGQLYAQVTQGAPFEVFLAADQTHPRKTIDAGFGVAGSRFTYAVGRLVLFSASKGLVTGENTLRSATFTRIAIANPATAPYGTAAVAAMRALGVYDRLRSKIVQGNNIAQAFQFVSSGNAEIGFVALSQIAASKTGSRWIVPATLHPKIAQDAVLLKNGADNPAAREFLAYLGGPQARAIIEKFGYGVDE
ncbi:MAG: molybdate ABC transporter substrate-binding protein [Hyphomicrobiaceae bacterium]